MAKRLPSAVDAVAALALGIIATLLVWSLHPSWLPAAYRGIGLTYLSHAALLAVAILWYPLIGRFPVGRVRRIFSNGWLWPLVTITLVVVVGTLLMFGMSGGRAHVGGMSDPLTMAAILLFQGLFVGISEEALFRGVVQTGLSATFPRTLALGSLRIGTGTILAAALFGAVHLLNPQPIAMSAAQALWAMLLGLIIGYGYERTHNLWGAMLAHNVSDLAFFAIVLALAR